MGFLINFLPDALIHSVVLGTLVAGAVITVISMVLMLLPLSPKPYVSMAQAIGIVLLVTGVWFESDYVVSESWKAKTEEIQSKVVVVEKQVPVINHDVETVYVDRLKEVKVNVDHYITKLKVVEKKVNADCKIDPSVIAALNGAARGGVQ